MLTPQGELLAILAPYMTEQDVIDRGTKLMKAGKLSEAEYLEIMANKTALSEKDELRGRYGV
jgi:hypothetical protein